MRLLILGQWHLHWLPAGLGCEGEALIWTGVWEMACLGLPQSHSLHLTGEWASLGGRSPGQASR